MLSRKSYAPDEFSAPVLKFRISMAPAQGRHAQIGKCRHFFGTTPLVTNCCPFSSPLCVLPAPQFCLSFSLLALPGICLHCTLPGYLEKPACRRESSGETTGFFQAVGFTRRWKAFSKTCQREVFQSLSKCCSREQSCKVKGDRWRYKGMVKGRM